MEETTLETYQEVESFRFADVFKHWGRERLVHEVVIGRELAKGIIRDGLRFQSTDPKWLHAEDSLRGEPLVGYAARPHLLPVVLRADALQHLLAIERNGTEPDVSRLQDEHVMRTDFRQWLIQTGRSMPAFWFGAHERTAVTI